MYCGDQAHLRDDQCGGDAFQTEANGGPHHWQEEQIKQLKAESFGKTEHGPQGCEDQD
jgi:hypothetical protein